MITRRNVENRRTGLKAIVEDLARSSRGAGHHGSEGGIAAFRRQLRYRSQYRAFAVCRGR